MADAGGNAFVWILNPEDMTVKKHPVMAGEMTGSGSIIIQKGLAGGETIVTSGVTKLRDGMKVSVWEK